MLTIKLLNPCGILNSDAIHHDLAQQSIEKCDEMYQELFIKEMQEMCRAENKRTLILRSKRFIVSLTVGLIVASIIATVGAAGVTAASVNSERIRSVNALVAAQATELEEASQKIDMLEMALNNLQANFNKTVLHLEAHENDFKELKAKSITSTYVISYITTRLLQGKQTIQEAYRQWKVKKIYPPLLDYLNFTLPCGDDCPLSLAVSSRCHMTEDHNEIYIDFSAPMIDNTLQLVEADPFELAVKKDDKICPVIYKGPRNAINSMKDGCTTAINIRPESTHEAILVSSKACISTTKLPEESKYFEIQKCSPRQPHDELHYIQLKPHFGLNYIYCPWDNITIDGLTKPCPEEVFTLPITATFWINEMEFMGSTVHLTHQETADPLFNMKTNWHLQLKVNLTHLLSQSSLPKGGKGPTQQWTRYPGHRLWHGSSSLS